MTTTEFKDEFDVRFNNIMSNQAPGLNGYDISVYLTRAQESIVSSYFLEKDYTLKREFDFSCLIDTATFKYNMNADGTLVPYGNNVGIRKIDNDEVFDEVVRRGLFFELLNKPVTVINERVIAYNKRKTDGQHIQKRQLSVRPISNDEYNRLNGRIDKNPPKYEAWRIHNYYNNTKIHSDSNHYYVNVVLPNYYGLLAYELQYVRMPQPIIVENIQEEYGTTINGIGVITECELPVQVHYLILDLAVKMAKADWVE